jgi:hypothetical protein
MFNMIAIPPIAPANQTSNTRRVARRAVVGDAHGFADALSAAEEALTPSFAPAASEAAALQATNPLLAMQEMSDAHYASAKALRNGHASLDVLDELRHALLTGSLPHGMLDQLEKSIAQQRQQADISPTLASIMDDIELRLAVERAKLERALEA